MALNKEMRITVYGPDGDVLEVLETKQIAFRKDGSMTIGFSAIFDKALIAVARGGAIFIERIWKV